ncbi:MAG TPA: hypothetical protein PKH31_09840 [Candidatus Sumerlaeota bacterium]|nr:hypothetical protein [Candidatus Sumerlaeota bacterium]
MSEPTKKRSRIQRWRVLIILVATVWLAWRIYTTPSPKPVTPPAFEGDSKDLKETVVVPTLDAPIPTGQNVIWCASFVSAWKKIEADVTGEPPALEGNPAIVESLNKAPDPRPDIPPSSLYVAAGWNQKGILQTIASDLKKQFPGKAIPSFPGIAPEAFVAYSYLEAKAAFNIPYFQNDEPLVFTDRAGREAQVSSFGIRPKDEYAYGGLRNQPSILYLNREKKFSTPSEYIVDLDRSSHPNQIILAQIEPKATLAETVAYADKKIAEGIVVTMGEGLEVTDVLLVPDIVWNISQRFTELEGRAFTNSQLKGQRPDVVQQDIAFRLDRYGAEIRSEFKMPCLPVSTHYIFNRPFLLYMKKRGATQPYFAMWVENAELLAKWKPEAGNEASSPSK